MKKILIISLLAIFAAKDVFAIVVAPVAAYGITGASVTTGTTATPIDSGKAPAFGVATLLPLIPSLSLEVDLIYAGFKFTAYDVSNSANFQENSLKAIVIPVLARYSFFPGFSIGAGPVILRGMGDITQQATAAGVAQPSQTVTWEAAGMNKTLLAGSVALGATIPVGAFYLVGDVRYTMGLANASTAVDTTMKLNAIHFVAGAAFDL